MTRQRQRFECGPGVSVVVAVPSRHALWVEAAVWSDEGSPTTVRLPVLHGQVTLGHGMCAGLIELEAERSYTALLTRSISAAVLGLWYQDGILARRCQHLPRSNCSRAYRPQPLWARRYRPRRTHRRCSARLCHTAELLSARRG